MELPLGQGHQELEFNRLEREVPAWIGPQTGNSALRISLR